uniref:Terminase n=1 Tax=viral metagenome TaxID=1070528 RepID=A0A6M3IQN8_9ZZZZ
MAIITTKTKKPPVAIQQKDYRNGGEGFARWVEDNVCLPIYPPGSKISKWVPASALPDTPDPDTGRSYRSFWEEQKIIMNEALRMEAGRFVYRLIILCWMRGEGKTFLNCLFQMWRFFCWPKQSIVLCANSKDQSEFVSFVTIKDIILNSPKLRRIVGVRNIQTKRIRLRDSKNNVTSVILNVTTASGLLPNLNNYSFTEIHEMKDPEFFQQVHGSIRNVPNAMGFIDSTVSSKDHILYRQYEAYINEKDPTIFFSYRYSKSAIYTDYWHPLNTQVQLDSYRTTFLPGAFDRYFKNLWTVGADKVFEPYMIEAINYLGINKNVSDQKGVFDILIERQKIYNRFDEVRKEKIEMQTSGMINDLAEISRNLWPVNDLYTLKDPYGQSSMISVDALDRISDLYDTDWAVICGIDRAQPMKMRTSARTIFLAIAKGLPGSRSDPNLGILKVPNYIYLLLYLTAVLDHSVEGLKSEILVVNEEYDGIDRICSETWGVFDMVAWCEEIGITLDMITNTYLKQVAAFTEFYSVVSTGRFKAPPLAIPGMRSDDLMLEELAMFDHDEDKKWFGSPEKRKKKGVQDDSVYALALSINGGRVITPDDFRQRGGKYFFGSMYPGTKTVGRY